MSIITSWKSAIAAIEAFDDCYWEGVGLDPPTPTAVTLAKRYAQEHASPGLNGHPPPSCISPTPGGGVAFWWRQANVVTCIEFASDGGRCMTVAGLYGLIASLKVEAK